jgi:hypothetical protein
MKPRSNPGLFVLTLPLGQEAAEVSKTAMAEPLPGHIKKRNGYRRTHSHARPATVISEFQLWMTRLTALGPLPFLSGSTSKLIR